MNPFGTPGFEELVIDRFNINAVHYTSLLNRAVESPRGLVHDPTTCRQIRERRERNARGRARVLA